MQTLKKSKFIKTATGLGLLTSLLLLQGCVRMMLPTSETELVTKSINGGGSVEVPLDYVQSYANLKQAYGKCVEYRTYNDYLKVEANLDRENNIGTFYGRPPYGTYIFKTTITPIDSTSSKLTIYTIRGSLLTDNANQNVLKKRLEQDTLRALGQDPKCNKG
ncbi:hypothetical protein [Acinetobacter sp. YH12052]|uniref:hypothetical protein n=1 Tax=Acinetobacter sp. YH12052 TaxID=2601055 RepID=UPI0015D178E5|nr:hypothetical protein [Acinetobacter sp. YH12052]